MLGPDPVTMIVVHRWFQIQHREPTKSHGVQQSHTDKQATLHSHKHKQNYEKQDDSKLPMSVPHGHHSA